jgi:hypothetical protein
MTDKGKQTRAGKLLSYYLRQIAEEETETIKDPETGEDRMATKAEALARQIWADALGHVETTVVDGKRVERIIKPSMAARSLIYDRLEGRSPMSVTEKDEKLTVAERVSEQGKQRIAKAGGLDADNS